MDSGQADGSRSFMFRQKNRLRGMLEQIQLGLYTCNITEITLAVVAEWFKACVKFKKTLTSRPRFESHLGNMISITQSHKWRVISLSHFAWLPIGLKSMPRVGTSIVYYEMSMLTSRA